MLSLLWYSLGISGESCRMCMIGAGAAVVITFFFYQLFLVPWFEKRTHDKVIENIKEHGDPDWKPDWSYYFERAAWIAAILVPMMVVLGILYHIFLGCTGGSCGYCDWLRDCWFRFFPHRHFKRGSWLKEEEGGGFFSRDHPRGTVRPSVELARMSFQKLFKDDGTLQMHAEEPAAKDDEDLKRMREQHADLRAQASKLEEASQKLFEQIDEAASQQDAEEKGRLQQELSELELAKKEKKEQAETLGQMLEATPEERLAQQQAQWQSWSLKALGDDDYTIEMPATEGSSSSSTARPPRKVRANNHAFQPREDAASIAQSRAETKAAEDALAVEGMYSVKLPKIAGKPLGLKYGPGLIITNIQDDSSAAVWNSENKRRQIQAGHKVVSINGKDNMQDMLSLLRDKDQTALDLVFFKQASVDDPLGSHLKVPLAGAGRARLRAVAALSAGTPASDGANGAGRGAGRGTSRQSSRSRSSAASSGSRNSAAPSLSSEPQRSPEGSSNSRPSQSAERSRSAPRSGRSLRMQNHGFSARSPSLRASTQASTRASPRASPRNSPRPSRDPAEEV